MLAVIMNNTNQDQAVHKAGCATPAWFGTVLPLRSPACEATHPLLPFPNSMNAPVILQTEGTLGLNQSFTVQTLL